MNVSEAIKQRHSVRQFLDKAVSQAALAEYPHTIKSALNLPDDAILLCGMALGYEDTTAPVNQYRTAREAVETFTHFYD